MGKTAPPSIEDIEIIDVLLLVELLRYVVAKARTVGNILDKNNPINTTIAINRIGCPHLTQATPVMTHPILAPKINFGNPI